MNQDTMALMERITNGLATQIAKERDILVANTTDRAAGRIQGMMMAADIIQREVERAHAGYRPDFEKQPYTAAGF